MDKKTVLVVDDDPSIRFIVATILRRDGFEPIEAPGGEQALEILASLTKPLEFIFTDRSMPGMNGDNFIAEVRRRGCWAPAIMMTGDGFLPDELYGVNIVIRKPFGPDEVRQAIRDAPNARPQGT